MDDVTVTTSLRHSLLSYLRTNAVNITCSIFYRRLYSSLNVAYPIITRIKSIKIDGVKD